MGDVKTHFWNLGRPYKGLLCIHIYITKISTSALNGIKCCKYCVNILGALKSPIWYRFCPGPGNSPFFWMVPVPVPEKIGPGKKYRYQKKVPVLVPEKSGPGKKYRSRYRKNLVPENSTGPKSGKKCLCSGVMNS